MNKAATQLGCTTVNSIIVCNLRDALHWHVLLFTHTQNMYPLLALYQYIPIHILK